MHKIKTRSKTRRNFYVPNRVREWYWPVTDEFWRGIKAAGALGEGTQPKHSVAPRTDKESLAFNIAKNSSPECKNNGRGHTGESICRTDGLTAKDAKSERRRKIANRNDVLYCRLSAEIAGQQRLKVEFHHNL